ncbi:MAG: hypothetical protein LBM70_07905 [Victivallales bacterium]|jgi:D-citramalate synthase|nr:hypothetical protein [Victivallales bacterium]
MKSKYCPDTYVEILDTTLRDGEQTPGVAFTPAEKLELAKMLLLRLKVDRLEIGSARVSDGERDAVSAILKWAEHRGCLNAMEILGFVDGGKSIDWIASTGGKVVNLLTKGSENHCRVQLRKSPARHFEEVANEILYAKTQGVAVNLYLEDWSNGMRHSFAYVHEFLTRLQDLPIERIMLPDTLGILEPTEVTTYLEWIYQAFPNLRLDFHGHNDYGMVTANSLAAVQMGVNGIHSTVNGLGERTGNQALSQLVVAINDLSDRKVRVVEKELQHASELVQSISGKRCAWNYPVVGSDVFTQTCGVHADGDKKGNLYANLLLPERFGRKRNYALGKLSGKASIDQNLEAMNLELAPEVRQKVLQEVIRLGDKKKSVSPSDLPFIIAGVLSSPLESRLKIVDYEINTRSNRTPKARVTVEMDKVKAEATSPGDGGYDAFMRALRKCMKTFQLTLPKLLDYEVRIPPGGKTDALVEATITWALPGKNIATTGIDSDQIVAAISATEKMLNLLLPGQPKSDA